MTATGANTAIASTLAPTHIPTDREEEEEDVSYGCCAPLSAPFLRRPVEIESLNGLEVAFSKWPVFGPLLFLNESSDARDHCANERTFLSYLRLSAYMAVVAIAIVLSFHLKDQPTDLELRMARPLGAVFWVLAVLCLLVGLANYIRTINKYSRKSAIVQSGWKTHVMLGTIAVSIVGTCVVLLVVTRLG